MMVGGGKVLGEIAGGLAPMVLKGKGLAPTYAKGEELDTLGVAE